MERRKITNEIVIKEGREAHGNRYGYELIEYLNYTSKMKIICFEHGVFEQSYVKHCKLKRGCWKCGKKSCIENRDTLNTKKYIDKVEYLHKYFYDYTKTVYIDRYTKIIIGCPIHGDFEQNPICHSQGQGCPSCGRERSANSRKSGSKEILKKFKLTHGDFYKYPKLEEGVKVSDIISIQCPYHGLFHQKISSHYKYGCSKCGDDRVSAFRTKIPVSLKPMVNRVKSRVKGFIKSKGYSKKSKTSKMIGIDWEGLKKYLEDNAYGFTINQENIDIDHIIPLSNANTEEELLKLCHYTNLQLLPSYYNQYVKGIKDFDKNELKDWLVENKNFYV